MGKPLTDNYVKVGVIQKEISNSVGCLYYGNVYVAPGLSKHIKKRHGHELDEWVLQNTTEVIKQILSAPDYFGKHPEKVGMEFIKVFDKNLMIGVEVDTENNYIYVATLHPITESKISNRLHSGRLKEYNQSIAALVAVDSEADNNKKDT